MHFFKKIMKKKRIFLDYASTTPIDKRVKEEMDKYEEESSFNPSALYSEGLSAKEVLDSSRDRIASLLSAQKNEIIFTSGGTEANNLAILGVFEAYKKENFTPHIVTCEIEHPAVLEVCKEVERREGEVTILPVSEDGLVSSKDVRDSLKDNTVLVSIMYANNEIGTVQPIKEIGRVIKEYRTKNNKRLPYFHTDACQAVLYEELHVQKLVVDLMTLDGIKMYGPRGAGLLYVKTDTEIHPINFGGGQERGLRNGTENVGASLGLARALEIATDERENLSERMSKLRDYAINKILKSFPTASLNGSATYRLPNNINICFPLLDAEFAVISLDVAGIAASYSSSCLTLKEDSSSYVMTALGKDDCKNSSLRFTLGRESKKEDIDALVSALQKIVK